MISDSLMNSQVGQSVPFNFHLSEDVTVQLDDREIVFKDNQGLDSVKFGVMDGLIQFITYDTNTGQWTTPQTLTPNVSSDNSSTLPHSVTDGNYLEVDSSGHKSYLNNQLKQWLKSNVLQLSDIPIIGVYPSNDVTSAVNLQQLQDSKYELFQNPTTGIAKISTNQGVPIFSLGSTIDSQLKMRYLTRPSTFTAIDIPDVKYVDDNISLCQPLSLKGVANGYVPLDSQAMIPTNFLPIMQMNQIYVGNDADKTGSQFYTSSLPLVGTLFIALDSQKSYILARDDYLLDTNWIQLAPTLNVLSINGKTGTVSINTDEIPEGSQNLYFGSGMSGYILNNANTANHLLQLNNSAQIDSQFYGNTLRLANGAVTIYDNQLDNLTFKDSLLNQDIIKLSASNIQVTSPIYYTNRPSFLVENYLADKQYVDDQDLLKMPVSYSLSTIAVNNPTTTDISMSGYKLTSVADPTLAQDAATKSYVDAGLSTKYDSTTPLNQITIPSANVDINNYKITNLATPTLQQDAATKLYVDTGLNLKYDKTTALNNITTATGSLNLGGQKIANVLDPILAQDVATKNYTDTALDLKYDKTTTLNNIALATSSINFNNNRAINLIDPVAAYDATTKNYVDTGLSTKYNSTTTLNNIVAPTSSVSLNSQKITNLLDPTLAQDATTKTYVDTALNLKYDKTTTLNNITAPTGSVSLNNQKITNLADPLDPTDAVNRRTVEGLLSGYYDASFVSQLFDERDAAIALKADQATTYTMLQTDSLLAAKYDNTTTLNNITAPTGSVSLNSQKITNMANGTLSADAVNYGQLNSSISALSSTYMPLTYKLNQISAPTSSVNLNSQKITSLADPTLAQDAATKTYVDTGLNLKYNSTTTLNNITAPTAAVSLNTQKIVNVADPTLAQDAATKNYVDTGLSTKYNSTTTLNNIVAPTAAVSLNSQKIINLADPTLAQDAATKNYTDTNLATKYANTTALNDITAPTSSVSLNSQKIVSMADPTLAQDATTKNYVDNALSLKYNQTTTLNNITAPTASVSLNSQKITNLLDPTLAQDATTKNYVDTNLATKYSNTTTLNNITAPTAAVSLSGQKIINLATPTLSSDAATKAYVDANAGASAQSLDLLTVSHPTTADWSNNNFKIINVADPVSNQDVVTKNYLASYSRMPVGSIIIWHSTTIPSGWLLCDGSTFSSTTYPDLFSILGTTTLPDFCGYFLRGLDTRVSGNVDPTTGRTISSIQTSANLEHTHTYQDVVYMESGGIHPNWTGGQGSGNSDSGNFPRVKIYNPATGTYSQSSDTTDPLSQIPTSSSGTTESRPINKAVNFIICASPSATSIANVSFTANADISMNNFKITNMANGTASTDAAAYGQLTSAVSTINSTISGLSSVYMPITYTLNQIGTATANINLNGFKFTNSANPTNNQDLITVLHGNNNYYQVSGSVPRIRFDSTSSLIAQFPTATSYKISKQGLSTYYLLLNGTDHSLEQYQDLYTQFGYTSGATLRKLSDTAEWLTRPLWVTNSASLTRDARLYVSRQGTDSQSYAMQISDPNTDNSYSSGGFIADCFTTLNRGVYVAGDCQFASFVNMGSYTSTQSGQSRLTVASGVNGNSIEAEGNIYASNFIQVVPISERKMKKYINDLSHYFDELENLTFVEYQYSKQQLRELGYKRAEITQNKKKYIGFCTDQFKENSEYLIQLTQTDFEDNSLHYTVNISLVKDRLFALLVRDRIQHKRRIADLEDRVGKLEQLVQQLIQKQ